MTLDVFGQRSMLFRHLFVAPLSLDNYLKLPRILIFLYTSFHGPDLSKNVIDDLVILCKLVVGLAGSRWWLIIDGLLYTRPLKLY